MKLTTIFPAVHAVSLGPVNVFLIEDGADLALVDTGYESSPQAILAAVRALGKEPSAVKNILVTHCHPDHAGGLARLLDETGAVAWMHPLDAAVVRGETPMIRSTPAPGLINAILYRVFIKNVPAHVPAAAIGRELADGDIVPVAGGIRAVHAPGHSAGHLAFVLERDGGLLFAADACSNMVGLGYSVVYDDLAAGRRSLAKLAGLPAGAICFGHGGALTGAAVAKFRRKWAQ